MLPVANLSGRRARERDLRARAKVFFLSLLHPPPLSLSFSSRTSDPMASSREPGSNPGSGSFTVIETSSDPPVRTLVMTSQATDSASCDEEVSEVLGGAVGAANTLQAGGASATGLSAGQEPQQHQQQQTKRKNTSFKITNVIPSRPPSVNAESDHLNHSDGGEDLDDSKTESISENVDPTMASMSAASSMTQASAVSSGTLAAAPNPTSNTGAVAKKTPTTAPNGASGNGNGHLNKPPLDRRTSVDGGLGSGQRRPSQDQHMPEFSLRHPTNLATVSYILLKRSARTHVSACLTSSVCDTTLGPKDRFKVVKLDDAEEVKKGRWTNLDFTDRQTVTPATKGKKTAAAMAAEIAAMQQQQADSNLNTGETGAGGPGTPAANASTTPQLPTNNNVQQQQQQHQPSMYPAGSQAPTHTQNSNPPQIVSSATPHQSMSGAPPQSQSSVHSHQHLPGEQRNNATASSSAAASSSSVTPNHHQQQPQQQQPAQQQQPQTILSNTPASNNPNASGASTSAAASAAMAASIATMQQPQQLLQQPSTPQPQQQQMVNNQSSVDGQLPPIFMAAGSGQKARPQSLASNYPVPGTLASTTLIASVASGVAPIQAGPGPSMVQFSTPQLQQQQQLDSPVLSSSGSISSTMSAPILQQQAGGSNNLQQQLSTVSNSQEDPTRSMAVQQQQQHPQQQHIHTGGAGTLLPQQSQSASQSTRGSMSSATVTTSNPQQQQQQRQQVGGANMSSDPNLPKYMMQQQQSGAYLSAGGSGSIPPSRSEPRILPGSQMSVDSGLSLASAMSSSGLTAAANSNSTSQTRNAASASAASGGGYGAGTTATSSYADFHDGGIDQDHLVERLEEISTQQVSAEETVEDDR